MKHSSSLAIWLGLGAAFVGLLTTLFAVLVARRKKAASAAARPRGDDPGRIA